VGEILGWNEATPEWYADFGVLSEERRNILWWMFSTAEARDRIVDWEAEARTLVGQFRALSVTWTDQNNALELVTELQGSSAEFRAWWDQHVVSDPRVTVRRLRHRQRGTVRMNVMTVYGSVYDSIGLCVHTPCAEREDRGEGTATRSAVGRAFDRPRMSCGDSLPRSVPSTP
jgi:hypothetical protein